MLSCADAREALASLERDERAAWHEPGTCGECRWFAPWKGTPNGWCRSTPLDRPKANDDWCGEWEPLRRPFEVWKDGEPTGVFEKSESARAGRGEAGDE
jgi:hypothetical protein